MTVINKKIKASDYNNALCRAPSALATPPTGLHENKILQYPPLSFVQS